MKDFSVKKVVLCSIMFMIALFTLLALCFHLVNVSMYGVGIGESGFSLFKFSSQMIPYQGMVIPFALICIIQLVTSISMITFSLLAFFKFPKETYRKIGSKIIVLGIVFCSVYLVMGIACAIVLRISANSDYGYEMSIMTYAFLPLLFVILFSIAYKICNVYIPENVFANKNTQNASGKASNTYTVKNQPANSEYSQIELLKEYGELLDKGYITREEFDAKKKEILNVGTAETTE